MAPFASILSAQDMRDVGAWYASQKAGTGVADDTVIGAGPNQGLKFYQIGESLYRAGDPARQIPACMACHGPSGAGNPGPAYPALRGQDSAYAVRRLEEYRAGTTTAKGADAAHFQLMASVAKTLTDEEIRSLGSYLQGLHARTAGTPKPASGP
jgi:cytochrome c553